MHSVLYLIRRFPGELANETIDLMLVSGVFEQPTSVIFMGDGVWQLVGDGSKIDRKDTARALNALPMYDVEALYVDETSLELRGIVLDTIDLPVKVISTDKLTHLLHDHDIVVGDQMLHIVSSPDALDACFSSVLTEDAVILIGDGVYAIQNDSFDSQIPVYTLESDLAARGIPATTNVIPTDISQFVALVVEHASSVTWT